MATITGGEVTGGRLERADRMAVGTSTAEAIAGAAGVVLPILGLVGVLPFWMAGIGVIVIGGGLLLEGAGLITHYSALLSESRRSGMEGALPGIGGGVTVQVLGGAAALVLGIISLRSAAPLALLGAAILSLGAAMLLGAGATARTWALEFTGRGGATGTEQKVAEEAARSSAGAEVFSGLAAVVLGILAVAGVGTPATALVLVLAAALALGSSVLLEGTSLGARMVSLLTR